MKWLSIDELTEIVSGEIGRDESMWAGGEGEPDTPRTGLAQHLPVLWAWKDCRRRTPTGSHRKRFGVAIRAAKRLYRVLFRPFINETLAAQAGFNDRVYEAFDEVGRALRDLEAGIGRCEARVERVAGELQAIERRLVGLEESVRGDSHQAGEEIDYARFHSATSSYETTKELYEQYIPRFAHCRRVADLGCGRGPFLELLAQRGIAGYGVERDARMVRECRAAGFEVVQADVLEYLGGLSRGAVDGIFAGHLVEHLELGDLIRFFQLVRDALADGGVFVFESPNTANLLVLAASYFRDPTHRLPRHPETYRHFVEACGFRRAEILYSLPADPVHRFPGAPEGPNVPDGVRRVLDLNAAKLNDLLCGYANFAIACRKGEPNG